MGDFTYSQSVVQGSLDSMLELSEMLRGDAPTEEEKAARLQATIDSFVGLGVIENKLTEAGKNDFTDAEIEQLNQTARSKYEELWQLLYQQMQKSDAAVTEEAVTEQMEDMGYTFQAIYDELALQTRQNRAIELFVGDIVLTQDQVDAYYEEQFVGPDREDYEGNVAKYDQEILMNNNEAFYTPEGYRYIRQIVLEIPEAALKAAKTESEPFVTEQGIHILCYAGDVPAGEHVLTDEERELLNAAALRYYQMEKLNALVEEWQGDYGIEMHPEMLKY